MKSIVLTGFMGSGKSTVGKLLAGAFGFDFIDIDEEIEKAAGKPIKDIFAEDGEPAFRQMERDIAAGIAADIVADIAAGIATDVAACRRGKGVVISTGGGFLTNDANAALFPKESFDIIFVDRDFEEMYQAIKDDASRPVAASLSKDELKALYEARLPYYKKYATRIMQN